LPAVVAAGLRLQPQVAIVVEAGCWASSKIENGVLLPNRMCFVDGDVISAATFVTSSATRSRLSVEHACSERGLCLGGAVFT
jgi:hypothetical protein